MDKQTFDSAVAALRLQEDILGKESVNLAIQSLRDQLHVTLQDKNQRKQATILFADISGFSNLSSKLDVEDVHLLVSGLWQLIDKIIRGFGGHIDKYMGDGFLAVFGLTHFTEDAPIRAIHAALEIQRKLKKYESDLSIWPIKLSQEIPPIQMRIGAHIGEVYLAQDGIENSSTVFGEAVNMASFIESIAPVGSVLITSDLADHIHGVFEVSKHSLTETKIVDSFVQTWLVGGERPLSKDILARSGRNLNSNLIGRGDALNWIKRGYYKTVTQKNLHIQTLFGEAGIGKTRLVKEFIDWLDLLPDSVALMVGQGDQHLQNRPFAMMKNSLCSMAGITGTSDPQIVAEKLTDLFDRLNGIDAENIRNGHLLTQLIGFNNLRNPFVQEAIHKDIDLNHLVSNLIFDTARKSMKRHKAILFILDDCQWGDVEFVNAVGNQLQNFLNMPIYILLVGRSSFVTRHDGWQENWDKLGISNEQRFLEPLSQTQSIELIKDLFSEDMQLPQNVLTYISAASSGNPYFIEEFVKVLIKTNQFAQTEENKKGGLIENDTFNLPIPTTLTGVLQARIEQLTFDKKRILFHAATVGYAFWDGLLFAMQLDDETKKSASQIEDVLNDLVEQGFILQSSSSKFVGHNEYRFRHQALRDVAYNAMLRKHKLIYHKIISEWIIEHRSELDIETANSIGDHYWDAGEVNSAIKWDSITADLCINAQNYRTAIRLYLRVVGHLPVKKANERRHYFNILGDLYERVGRYDKAIVAFEEIIAHTDDDEVKARTFNKLCSINLTLGNAKDLLNYAELGLAAAICADVPSEIMMANYYLGEAFRNLGNLMAAMESAKRAFLICSNSVIPLNNKARILGLLSTIFVQLGQFEEAAFYINMFDRESISLFKDTVAKKEIGHSLLAIGRYKFQLGHYKDAVDLLSKSYEIFDKLNEPHSSQYALISLTKATCAQGDYAKALTTAQQVVAINHSTNVKKKHVAGMITLGLMHLHNGNFSEGQLVLEKRLKASETYEAIVNPKLFYYLAAAKITRINYFEAQIDAMQAVNLAQQLQVAEIESCSWMMLGVASGKQRTTVINDGKILSSTDCFNRAIALSETLNQHNQVSINALATVLYISGSYQIVYGDKEAGREMVAKARGLFEKWNPLAEQSKLIQALLPDATK